MKVGIVILNYKDYENTSRYVNLIKEYNIINEVIVVDNNSNDGNFSELKKLENEKITVVKTDKNGGYAYGNNYGIKMLDNDTDYVIISNPDVYICEKDIIECINFFSRDKKIAIVAPRMNFTNGPARRSSWKERTFLTDIANSTRLTQAIMFKFFKNGEYTNKDYEQEYLEVQNIAGSFFIADKNIFEEIGYFDENTFLFYEEDIIGHKLSKKGYKIFSLNNIQFMHYDSRTIGKLMNIFKKQKILFQSRKYYQKTYNNVNKILLVIFDLLYIIRCIELFFEILVRKIVNRFKKCK